MKRLFVIVCCLIFFSCKEETTKGKFTVSGEIKNATDQKIFLEELYFGNKPPVVIDTSVLEKGKVNIKGIGTEEGLYRVRMEDGPGYIFINDKDDISFTADAADQGYKSQTFNSPANASLKNFVTMLDSMQGALHAAQCDHSRGAVRGVRGDHDRRKRPRASHHGFRRDLGNTAASDPAQCHAMGTCHPSDKCQPHCRVQPVR